MEFNTQLGINSSMNGPFYGPAHNTFVLIAFASGKDSVKPAHRSSLARAFCFLQTQRMDVDEDSDQNLNPLSRYTCILIDYACI